MTDAYVSQKGGQIEAFFDDLLEKMIAARADDPEAFVMEVLQARQARLSRRRIETRLDSEPVRSIVQAAVRSALNTQRDAHNDRADDSVDDMPNMS